MSTALMKFYDPAKKRVVFIQTRLLSALKPKIVQIVIGKDFTTLRMAPEWFHHDAQSDAVRNIVYPSGTNPSEQRSFDAVARYRAAAHHPNNDFRRTSVTSAENNTETLIVALDSFIEQFDGQLSFTNDEVTFEETAHRTACGVANLSSAHLLATDYIPTGKFSFLVDLDYRTDLARSSDTMQNYALSFANAIAEVLTCPNDYVRVTSLQRLDNNRRQTKVNFGVTTPNPEETERLVKDLQVQARKGFANHRILKSVKPDEYECKWKPLITFFQLQPSDFAQQFNVDYTPSLPEEDTRGGLPYFLPIGWFRHALNVVDKYPNDKQWLGSSNADGEWAVAFHGTHGGAVKGIKEEGLLITTVDLMRDEAVQKGGKNFDQPGLYVATHCDGGAHPLYTRPFTVPSSRGKSDQFRVVFQCRVQPGAYTAHANPVNKGEAWRFVDPDAIRPYGILIKHEENSI